MTVKKSCKYVKYGSFDHLLFLLQAVSLSHSSICSTGRTSVFQACISVMKFIHLFHVMIFSATRHVAGWSEAVCAGWPDVWWVSWVSLCRQVCPFLLCQRHLPSVLLWILLGANPLPPWPWVPQAPRQGGSRPASSRSLSLVLRLFKVSMGCWTRSDVYILGSIVLFCLMLFLFIVLFSKFVDVTDWSPMLLARDL